jgi:hypothetical protein
MGELESLVAEKDEIIRELREEGEKLSKQQLQHSNIIKKLRAKEKETDNTVKNQKYVRPEGLRAVNIATWHHVEVKMNVAGFSEILLNSVLNYVALHPRRQYSDIC